MMRLSSRICWGVLVGGWMLAGGDRLLGCATCFGASDSKMAQGMNMGILALLVVVGCVLGGIAAFFGTLVVRAHRVSVARTTNEPMPAPEPALKS